MLNKLFLLALVALAVAMAVPTTRAGMVEKAAPAMNALKAKLVPGRLEAMASQLNARVNRGESLPSNWNGWLERDFTSSPEDPWGNYYYFRSQRRGFTVGSMGPDGRQGTEDDITYEHTFR